MKGKQIKVASVDNLKSLARKGKKDVMIVAMRDVDMREFFLNEGELSMLNAARKEPVEIRRGKVGMEGSTYLSLLHLRNIIEHLPCSRHFEEG